MKGKFEQPARSKYTGPRVNDRITASPVRLIGADGQMAGVVPVREALELAGQAGLDLVEIAPNSEPPVCKIMDFGKYRYEAQKKAKEARKHQKTIQIKEIKFKVNIDDHDYGVKLRSAKRFIGDGDKVKVTLRFRGREMAHHQLGEALLQRFATDMAESAKVESQPRMEAKQLVMMLGPK